MCIYLSARYHKRQVILEGHSWMALLEYALKDKLSPELQRQINEEPWGHVCPDYKCQVKHKLKVSVDEAKELIGAFETEIDDLLSYEESSAMFQAAECKAAVEELEGAVDEIELTQVA